MRPIIPLCSFRRQVGSLKASFHALLLVLLLLTSATVEAVTTCPAAVTPPSQAEVQAAMSRARDRGFLWRVSKDGHTSYLYGTIHIAKFEWMFPGPKVMGALQATDTVALELDLLDEDIRNRMMKGLAKSVGAKLPESLRLRMQKQAEASCASYDSIANLSPEMQITMLTVMSGRRDGLEAAYAIDAVLAGFGHGAGKHMVSLETPEAQLELLQTVDEHEVQAFVQDSLTDLESGHAGDLLKRIAMVWADSDYAELARYAEWCECMNGDMEREMMRRMLDERNPKLASSIDALHASGRNVFAAVGSLHMFGPSAIPVLLGNRGYRVERVELKLK